MVDVEEVHKEIINAGNVILKNLGSDLVIDSAEYFFSDKFYFLFLKEAFPNVEFEMNENATTSEEMASNIDAILEFLSKRLLEIDLSHIQGTEIVARNIDHITKLLQLLYELSILINEKQNTSKTGSVRESNTDAHNDGKASSDEIPVSLRTLIRNQNPPFLKAPWRYRMKRQYRPYDSDIEEANQEMNEHVLNDEGILNRAESATHFRISDLLPESAKDSQQQEENSKRTQQELKSWSESLPKEEIKGEAVIEDNDALPKKSVSKISEVSKSKESSTFEDKAPSEGGKSGTKEKKKERKKANPKKQKDEPKTNPKHFVFQDAKENMEDLPENYPEVVMQDQMLDDSENVEKVLNRSSPAKLQNNDEESEPNEMNPDEEIEILKQQLKETLNDEDGIKQGVKAQNDELNADKMFAIQNRPSNVPRKSNKSHDESSNSESNRKSLPKSAHSSKNEISSQSEEIDTSKKQTPKSKKKPEASKQGKPMEKANSKKTIAPAKKSNNISNKQSKESHSKSKENSSRSKHSQEINNENLHESENEREKEINDKIYKQQMQLKQQLKESSNSSISGKIANMRDGLIDPKQMQRELRALKMKEKRLNENLEILQKSRATRRDTRQVQICQKISKICVQLEKDKLREEQNKTIEGRKERVNQKKCVLEQMDSFYGGLIGEVKQQIRKERNERKLVESTHRAALMNLVKEISSSKVGELESCVDILVDEIKKSDEENEDQILTQEFMNMYKNI